MTLWLMFFVIGVVTYAIRLSCIGLLGQREMPALLLKSLRFVPLTVLPAIILPQLFLRNNTLALSIQNPRWMAGILAAIVAWRTRNVLLTIAVGMVGLWVLQFVLER
ncbi:MAG TPA: AzlD domain-containing protein [Ktedonobacteraceae bacterium]|nr:AzlD domain-containing protein [Ktedonobacteraceae bacterium]